MADEPTPDAPKADPKPHTARTVTLAVGFPVTSHADGKTVFTEAGTEVPAGDADDFIARAAAAGATLFRVEA